MKHTIFTLFTAALLTAASCQKEPVSNITTVEVSGHMLTKDSLQPAANCLLDLITPHGSYSLPPGQNQLITDANGNFKFSYTGPDGSKVGISFGGNSSYHNIPGISYFAPHRQPNYQLIVQPYGWLKLHVKNIDVQSPNDYLGVSAGGGNYELLYGIVDKNIIWKVPGNGRTFLTWTIRKNQIETKYNDTIYCPGYDTTFYQILY